MFKTLLIAVIFFLNFSVYADEIASDNFGYKLTSLEFQLKNIQETGHDIGLDLADDAAVIVPIGFSFSFYGIEYTEVEVSSNGFITFTPTADAVCCDGEAIPQTGGELDNFVAGYWQDFDLSQGGTIRTLNQEVNGQQIFTIGFYQLADNDSPEEAISTFEITLYKESDDIEIQYGKVQYDAIDDKVMGIENYDGSDGIELAFYSANADMETGTILHQEVGYCFSTKYQCKPVAKEPKPTPIPEPSTFVLFIIAVFMLLKRYAQ